MMTPQERAAAVVKNVRDDEMFNVACDDLWYREILQAIQAELSYTVPIADFVTLYDAAHGVIDHIRLHDDHGEYHGGMNAVLDFRETSAEMLAKHHENFPDLPDIEDEDWPAP